MKARKTSSAFTLMELLVVIGIIVILASIMVPVVNTLTKGNAQKNAVNTISVYLAAARTQAIAEGRQVGIVFFEDPQNTNQTAMQICGETATKIAGASAGVEFSTFTGVDSKIQYLPRGVRVATLSGAGSIGSADNSAGNQTRAIIFDPQGQLVIRNGLCVADYVAGTTYRSGEVVTAGSNTYMSRQDGNQGNDPTLPASADYWRLVPWHFDANYTTPGSTQGLGFSSPGLFVYDQTEFANFADGATYTNDNAGRFAWLRDHADVILINLNTGAVIR